jgi:hypothetical protein
VPKFPAPQEGILLTHFIVSDDIERSRRFYTDGSAARSSSRGSRRSSRLRMAG